MRRLALALACGAGGYVAGGILGYALVMALSGNTHDRDLEAAMTGGFVVGPLVALIAALGGALRGGWKTGRPPSQR